MANAIDPRLFAGDPIGDETQFNPSEAGAGQVVPDAVVRIDDMMNGTQLNAIGEGVRKAADRERATRLESIGAAIFNLDGARLIERMTKPGFEPEQNFNLNLALKNTPLAMTEDELDYVQGTRSSAEYQYKVSRIEDLRNAQQAAGDNPVTSILGGIIGDPMTLAGVVLTGGVGALAVAGRATMTARAVAGALNAVAAGAVTSLGEGPTSTNDVIANMLLNGAAGAWAFKPGVGRVKVDPDFPQDELTRIARQTATQTSPLADPAAVKAMVDRELKTSAQTVGDGMQWNIRKSMSNFGPAGKKVADILFDNNSDLGQHSMESHRWSIRQELTGIQRQWEDTLRESMAEEGAGIWKRLTSPRQAAAKQAEIEEQVQREMFRREQFQRQGIPYHDPSVPARITKMADQLDAVHALALKELKAAGVEGAEDLVEKAGWHHRRWSSTKIDDAIAKFKQAGLTDEAAKAKIGDMVGMSVRLATPNMDAGTAKDIGHVIVNRALRKGYFEDNIMSGGHSAGELAQIRDLLQAEGVHGKRAERIMDALRTNTDEAGKAGFMKHRMDLDYKASTFINGHQISVMDLIDTQMTRNVDQYLDHVSTQAAMARKGLRKQSDVDALREELLHGLAPGPREEAKVLFDQTMDHFYGRPSGQAVNKHMRNMGVYGRMIALANSGLWQTTEYATMLGKYGVLKTMKYAMQEMPIMRTLFKEAGDNPKVGRQLYDVLTQHSEQNVRIRPFTNRFEDGFEYGAGDTATLLGQTGGQLVPYINAMKFIHTHQARMASNLVIDRLGMAAKGDVRAAKALQKYGLESQGLNKLKTEIKAHGYNVDAWDDAVWAEVRPAFGKMMDEAVLHARVGDMPAFAMFDNVGKFMFTYRSFMLTAHNKILAGGLARDGMGPTALMMAYQFPLAAAAVQAQSLMQGKGALSEKDMAAKALGQMGGMGIGSEIAGVLSGQKGAFGSPGLIPVDRAYKLVGSAARGQYDQSLGTVAQMIPLVALTPARNLGQLLKD